MMTIEPATGCELEVLRVKEAYRKLERELVHAQARYDDASVVPHFIHHLGYVVWVDGIPKLFARLVPQANVNPPSVHGTMILDLLAHPDIGEDLEDAGKLVGGVLDRVCKRAYASYTDNQPNVHNWYIAIGFDCPHRYVIGGSSRNNKPLRVYDIFRIRPDKAKGAADGVIQQDKAQPTVDNQGAAEEQCESTQPSD